MTEYNTIKHTNGDFHQPNTIKIEMDTVFVLTICLLVKSESRKTKCSDTTKPLISQGFEMVLGDGIEPPTRGFSVL